MGLTFSRSFDHLLSIRHYCFIHVADTLLHVASPILPQAPSCSIGPMAAKHLDVFSSEHAEQFRVWVQHLSASTYHSAKWWQYYDNGHGLRLGETVHKGAG